ncbi:MULTISPECIES: sensor histidine kinase KdpD [unclassified Novosphingobium]|uniref:sensor histidine kinase n=1 Tax=unclassified Novosphingobium TaxID=2644732 RepID=UPI00160CD673|nr:MULTISPECIES: ATP-binding protein [unclassified Novosphingobium]MBB3376092.1 signal transduction histidine kinase [Novosphingobium sp. BK280]MBB3380314.1 signal transduction histidine kinase [Novosphingobium sp. BK258]MBB3599292.1 signal transduction histidine kinase [Novosphingobium sp. BK540]
MQRGTLSFRITVLLVGSFVLLQLAVFALTWTPGRDEPSGGGGLPSVAQVRAMVDLIAAVPPPRRVAVAKAFDGALYHVLVEGGPLPPTAQSAQAMNIGRVYSRGLPGYRLSVTGRAARFRRLARLNPWPGWMSDPLAIHVTLGGDQPAMLTIESQPSQPVRTLLRQRAALLGVGGIAALVALAFAVRATTQPMARLARDIRTYRGEPDSPDLAVAGSPELRELAQAYNEMKGRITELMAERTRVLAAIAHDMRTYITRIRLRAEFIDDAEQRERAARDLDEMAALLEDTLLLARAEASRAGMRRSLDLAAELRRAVEIHQEMGDAVVLSLSVERASVVAAPLAVRRTLTNLIDNGLRHGTQVVLSLCEDRGRWRIDISDDGPGIAADKLSGLGQPFGRIDPSRDRSAGGGAGLGLAIVRALITAQDGEIAFANRDKGGFLVSIWLPASL